MQIVYGMALALLSKLHYWHLLLLNIFYIKLILNRHSHFVHIYESVIFLKIQYLQCNNVKRNPAAYGIFIHSTGN